MNLANNLEAIEERIARACMRSGRKREEITLMAVSKFQPIEAVIQAWEAGLRYFGESRVQEAAAKYDGFWDSHEGECHLIGSLQRNKVKLAASLFDCIQSADREALVLELLRNTAGRTRPLPLLLEFLTGEDSKSGFTSIDDLFRTVELILVYPSLSIRGLMTIAPNTREEAVLRSAFRQVVKLRQELERRFPSESCACAWSCLSMGMSGDYELAVEEGSTLLRIGSAIFGERM